MTNFVRTHIRRYQSYVPGEQSSSKIIKLNANENHFSPHPQIKTVLKNFSIKKLRYYPDPHALELETVVRKTYRLRKDVGLVFGNGADEIIRGIFKAFFTPFQDSLLLTEFTYTAYKTYAGLEGIALEYLPVNPDFSISFKGLEKSRSRVFFLTNPNNPTGMVVKSEVILTMLKKYPHKLFVVDEAYADFGSDNCIKLLPRDNLIVIRTLSKSFSVCGLRLGWGAATREHAHAIRKVLDPYNLGALTMEIGKIILSDLPTMKKNVAQVREIRNWLQKKLIQINFQVYPSKANFLLVKPPLEGGKGKHGKHQGMSTAKSLFQFLKKNKIFVRYFDIPRLADCLRITVGSKKDLLYLLAKIKEYYGMGKKGN